MTHDELIMKLWEKRNAGCDNLDIHFTLSAVVELHKPFQVNDILLCECEPLPYPCPTIQVVEKELV
jgi:hypothetical protein